MKEVRDASRYHKTTGQHWNKRWTGAALQFTALFVFWLILSGHYQVKYIVLGALSAGLVTFLTNDIFTFTLRPRGGNEKTSVRHVLLQLRRFLAYLPWLLSRIIKANLQVAYLVLHPRMPIDPVLLQFRTQMQSRLAQVILANSITLTPGTVTISLEDGRYVIHVLVPPSAEELVDAKMQNKVGEIFIEKKEEPPTTRWAYSLEELKQ